MLIYSLLLRAGCPGFEELLHTLFDQLRHLLHGMRECRAAIQHMNIELGVRGKVA